VKATTQAHAAVVSVSELIRGAVDTLIQSIPVADPEEKLKRAI
jgi:hypothetical protein